MSEKVASAMVGKFMRGNTDVPASPLEALSDRELEVFRMLGQGKPMRLIAEAMSVTTPTVNSFRNRIQEKLQLKTSTEVMLRAIQWVQDEDAGQILAPGGRPAFVDHSGVAPQPWLKCFSN